MKTPVQSPLFLLKLWNMLRPVPGGKFLYRRALAQAVPYSATIRPDVRELRPGFAKIGMKDRRSVHNHLGSIHAVALANLAELTSGLALNCGLPENARGILKAFSIDYLKKARGPLTATSETPLPSSNLKQELTVIVETRDSSGAVVTRAQALWLIGPKLAP